MFKNQYKHVKVEYIIFLKAPSHCDGNRLIFIVFLAVNFFITDG